MSYILFIAGVLIPPFILGELISRILNVKDLSGRFTGTFLAISLGLAPFAWNYFDDDSNVSDAIKLGIDLAGGTNLVYQVDVDAAEENGKTVDSRSMDLLVGAIGRRINAGGTEETTVRKVGSSRVEVIVPGVVSDDVNEIKRRITNLGSLEFGILCNQYDDSEVIRKAEGVDRDVFTGKELVAQWRNVGKKENGTRKEVIPATENRVISRIVKVKDEEGKEQDVKQFLVRVEPESLRVTGKFLTRAYPSVGENGGEVVSFNLNAQGGYRFGELTSKNRPRQDKSKRNLAVVLNGEVHSAPQLNGVITTSGMIEGSFTKKEIRELTDVLNAGALELPLISEPVNEFSISPLLGIDVQEKGKAALIAAAIAVLIFMLVYYWFAGFVADVCLIINIVLVLGAMALIQATFTLPGLAGLVLTIGMTVDANVLIFERIREEINKGSSLRMGIHNGFGKAFTTIVDANLTTLLTAVILFSIGTDQVKGFAVTLFIGIVMGMFSALFVGRLIFDLFEQKRWIKSLPMFALVGQTNFKFMRSKAIAAVLSIVVILGGLFAVYSRGQDNLDIDFTGGSMVTFKFDQGAKDNENIIDDAKKLLVEKFDSSITLERLEIPSSDGGEVDIFFRLRTINGEVKEVRNLVEEAFEGSQFKLHHVNMTPTAVASITKAEPKEGEEENADEGNDAFAGGSQFKMAFSDEISIETAKQYLTEALKEAKVSEDLLSSSLNVQGTAGSGMEAIKEDSKRFSEMEVLASSVIDSDALKAAVSSMQGTMSETPIFEGVNTFDTSVASETQQNAILAMLLSLVAIVAYIWLRFESVTFGLAAVAALVHDILVVLGCVAFASLLSSTPIGAALGFVDFKINLPMIAAFLTIVGYSLNDTIVVFDRIREVRGKNPKLTSDMVDTSLNQTLSRTLLTSLTTLIVVLILYSFGGEGIHGFAFCLVAGILVGTYSSIYVASPVLVWLMEKPIGSAPSAAGVPAKANA